MAGESIADICNHPKASRKPDPEMLQCDWCSVCNSRVNVLLSLTGSEIKERLDKLTLELVPRQKRFADEWLVNGNVATRAYLTVYKAKNNQSAAVGGSKLLKVPKVASYIQLCRAFTTNHVLDHLTVSKDRVLDEEAKIAFIDVRELFHDDGRIKDPKEWPETIARCIAGIDVIERWDAENQKAIYTYKIRFNDKGRSLDRLQKVLGMQKTVHDLGDETTSKLRDFLESIDGKSRGVLPADQDC